MLYLKLYFTHILTAILGSPIGSMLSCPNVDGSDQAMLQLAEVILENAIREHLTYHAEHQHNHLQNYLLWKEAMAYVYTFYVTL